MANSKGNHSEKSMSGNELMVQFDNQLRTELGIGDPKDAHEVAQGLIRKYEDEAKALQLESIGLPFTSIDLAPADPGGSGGACGSEWDHAVRDIERDLDSLSSDARLKEIDIELRAWGTSIRTIVSQGYAAASLALDPRQRDRTFAARRSLGEYARLSRYVGALSSGSNLQFRQLAQSLDVAASLLLVLMGETLARAGTRAGQFLLQAPASELQARRDAVLLALRNLTGSVQEAYTSQEWPRGLEGYRQLLNELNQGGHNDLRAIFNEDALAQQLNDLVNLAAGAHVAGLRSLGATAHVTLQRFRRVLQLGRFFVTPESPPLASFFSAISLFLNAFESTSSGSRLLFVARPAIVFYGHYGAAGPTTAVDRLNGIIIERGRLAEEIDCYANCLCEANELACLVRLDKILYDLDRAIDLYSVGVDQNGYGEPEHRAASYGAVISSFLRRYGRRGMKKSCLSKKDTKLYRILRRSRKKLGFGTRIPHRSSSEKERRKVVNRMHSEICMQLRAEALWEDLVRRLAPGCRQEKIFGTNGAPSVIESLLDNEKPRGALQHIRALIRKPPRTCDDIEIGIPPHFETSLEVITEDVTRRGEFRAEAASGAVKMQAPRSVLHRRMAEQSVVVVDKQPHYDDKTDIAYVIWIARRILAKLTDVRDDKDLDSLYKWFDELRASEEFAMADATLQSYPSKYRKLDRLTQKLSGRGSLETRIQTRIRGVNTWCDECEDFVSTKRPE